MKIRYTGFVVYAIFSIILNKAIMTPVHWFYLKINRLKKSKFYSKISKKYCFEGINLNIRKHFGMKEVTTIFYGHEQGKLDLN